MNYQQAWEYLDGLQFHKIKLGLDAMRSFMAKVGNPEQNLKIVHVAGTNGKGSMSMTLSTIMSEAGYRVGLYTSPHLSSVRERFRVNGRFISERMFAEFSTRIREVLGNEKITYFEFTTALAFLWFAEENLDLVVLETGLGGRLDATNIVDPIISIITNVSMDHEMYLGDTVTAVASEKAGIIKQQVPVISAVKEDSGLAEVRSRCTEKGARLFLYEESFYTELTGDNSWQWKGKFDGVVKNFENLRCSMKGEYQVENASLALAAIVLLMKKGFNVTEKHIRKGIARVQWPGRLESFCLDRTSRLKVQGTGGHNTVSYLLDGAHNPAGVESLVQTLKAEYRYRRLILVWGAMADKDLQKTLPQVARLADRIILTKPEGDRSAKPELLYQNVPKLLQEKCLLLPDVEDAVGAAEEMASNDDLVLVAGSLYLIGASRRLLLGELVDE